jgi:hypothetical protein
MNQRELVLSSFHDAERRLSSAAGDGSGTGCYAAAEILESSKKELQIGHQGGRT